MMSRMESGAQSLRSALRDGRPTDSVEVERLAAAVGSMLFGVPRAFSIARYRIQRPIGEGASGVVYEAFDPERGREVAVKVLRTRTSEELARFRREAEILDSLRHPAIVRVHDSGVEASPSGDGQRAFIVTDLVHGTDIVSWCARRPVAQRRSIALAAVHAVAAAHRVGVTHCDLKPEHLLVDAEGRLTVIDFGLARATQDADEAPPRLAGTPGYMAPELGERGSCDPRSDQFALCTTIWEALFERHPFGEPGLARVTAIADARLDARVRSGSARVLARGLAHDPARRWPDLDALAHALAQAEQGRVRRLWLLGLLAMFVAVMLALGVLR